MKFKVCITGGNSHFRVDMVIHTDTAERVVFLRNYARKNKFNCRVELIDY